MSHHDISTRILAPGFLKLKVSDQTMSCLECLSPLTNVDHKIFDPLASTIEEKRISKTHYMFKKRLYTQCFLENYFNMFKKHIIYMCSVGRTFNPNLNQCSHTRDQLCHIKKPITLVQNN